MLQYIPYILLFALATMLIYGWGLWRSTRQKQDLSNMLSAKGISRIKKALKKNGSLTRRDLEPFVKGLTARQPFSKEQIGVTDPGKFLDSILPYMIRQKMITEKKDGGDYPREQRDGTDISNRLPPAQREPLGRQPKRLHHRGLHGIGEQGHPDD